MTAPSEVEVWTAEAVIRVYEPWLSPRCTVVGARHRREVAELVEGARRITAARRATAPPRWPDLWPVADARRTPTVAVT